MTVEFAPRVSTDLRTRIEASETFRELRAKTVRLGHPFVWHVEAAREADGDVEAWLFAYVPGNALPQEHLHLTLHRDRSESIVVIRFMTTGGDRVLYRRTARGPSSAN